MCGGLRMGERFALEPSFRDSPRNRTLAKPKATRLGAACPTSKSSATAELVALEDMKLEAFNLPQARPVALLEEWPSFVSLELALPTSSPRPCGLPFSRRLCERLFSRLSCGRLSSRRPCGRLSLRPTFCQQLCGRSFAPVFSQQLSPLTSSLSMNSKRASFPARVRTRTKMSAFVRLGKPACVRAKTREARAIE